MDWLALVVAGVVCAVVQRGIGVGYSLVLLPAAIALLPDGQAVPCVLAAGVVLSGGLLIGSGARPRLDAVTRGLLVSAPLGQALALAALGGLRGPTLRATAACVLLAGCAGAIAQGRVRTPAPGLRAGLAAGFVIGTLGALTGVIGPFVALLLTLRADSAGETLRRRLWTCTAWLSATALILAALLGTNDLGGAAVGLALAPALAVGALAGAPLARRLKPAQHHVTIVSVAALGAATLLAGL